MKKFTAAVLAMLMVIGMVGTVCAEYEAGGIKKVLGAGLVLSIDVEADAMAKASAAKAYTESGVVEAYYNSNGRAFDFRAVIDLANVETKYAAGKARAKSAFVAEEVDVDAYMAAFDALSVVGSFTITVNYAEGLELPEITADMVAVDETLFTVGEITDDGAGKITITVNVADGVKAKDVETKLFESEITLTCEGVKAAEVGTYAVSGSMTGYTDIKEGEDVIANITYTAVQDDADAEGELAVTVDVVKHSGSTSSADASDSSSKPSGGKKDPVVTVKGDEITVPKNEADKDVTVDYKPAEDVVTDTIVVLDSEGNVIEATYDAEKGTLTFPAGDAGKYTIEAATEEEVMILTIDEHNAHVFGEEKANDVAPVIRNDRTMLPARFVAENLGAEVAWDEEARKVTITKGDIVIEITIDAETAIVNGEEVKLDSPAFIENDRTYTPIRFIAEALGAKVFWNGETQKVTIVK